MTNELCKGVIAERDALNNHLGNLLAVIHRDGGHYQDAHGTDKAVADAMLIVPNLIADLYAEKSLRHSRESALESLTQTYVDVVEERSKLEAEVERLIQIIGMYGTSVRFVARNIQKSQR
ncbi:MAG: hypothetical protein JZU60_02030 [Ilumatobacteraceae bacterium]|jgi:hypothetical protein|nr:hypothetical protein [Ilumatobacteraceae bacterium]